MRIGKTYLMGSLDYLYNVTGVRYELSSQCAGRGRGYSIMLNGRHVMTHGHVPAQTLDACVTAFVRGFHHAERNFLPEGLK